MTGEVWFADDPTGCTQLEALRRWLDNLTTCFGYFTNGCKTCLIMDECHLSTAITIFAGTNVLITIEGRNILVHHWATNRLMLTNG